MSSPFLLGAEGRGGGRYAYHILPTKSVERSTTTTATNLAAQKEARQKRQKSRKGRHKNDPHPRKKYRFRQRGVARVTYYNPQPPGI